MREQGDHPAAQIDSVQQGIARIQSEWKGQSALGRIGKSLEPLFIPLGWDSRVGMATLASFPAREVIIGTLSLIYQTDEPDAEDKQPGETSLAQALREATWDGNPSRKVFTIPVALSLLVFFCALLSVRFNARRYPTRDAQLALADFHVCLHDRLGVWQRVPCVSDWKWHRLAEFSRSCLLCLNCGTGSYGLSIANSLRDRPGCGGISGATNATHVCWFQTRLCELWLRRTHAVARRPLAFEIDFAAPSRDPIGHFALLYRKPWQP